MNKIFNNIDAKNIISQQIIFYSTDEETFTLKIKNIDDSNTNIDKQKSEIKQQNFIPKKNYEQTNNIVPYNASINSQVYEYYKETNAYLKNEQMQFSSNIELTKKAIIASLNNQQMTIILQKILMESSSETIESIVKELKGEYRKIISDKNGNYFCSDLFKICTQKDRILILEELSPYLSEDCINHFGTYPIRTLVDCSNSEAEYNLILYSFNDYNKLRFASLDPYGNFIIQKIITKIPEHFRKDFNYIFTSFIGLASKRKYGIITAEKFLDYTKDKNIIGRILNIIKNDFKIFAEDQYGNYLIQYILEKWADRPEGKEIKDLVLQNFKNMSQKKYSSFICELIIKLLSEDEKMQLIKTLDLNEFKNMNNQHVIKIMKLLGIYTMAGGGINNYPNQNRMHLFLYPNNFVNNNYIPLNIYNQRFQNQMNFENNNNNQSNN